MLSNSLVSNLILEAEDSDDAHAILTSPRCDCFLGVC